MQSMNIGQAAKASGVSAKMIRHYEEVGLVPEPQRTDSGYRQYAAAEVHTLRFIRQARDLGFSIREIGELLSLWHNRKRAEPAGQSLGRGPHPGAGPEGAGTARDEEHARTPGALLPWR
jgi:DNA-binding transcriptional MerR regulator